MANFPLEIIVLAGGLCADKGSKIAGAVYFRCGINHTFSSTVLLMWPSVEKTTYLKATRDNSKSNYLQPSGVHILSGNELQVQGGPQSNFPAPTLSPLPSSRNPKLTLLPLSSLNLRPRYQLLALVTREIFGPCGLDDLEGKAYGEASTPAMRSAEILLTQILAIQISCITCRETK